MTTQETAMNEPLATTSPAEPDAGGIPYSKIAIGIAAIVGLVVIGRTVGEYIPQFNDWVQGLGFWGPLVFSVAYALAVVAFVPASLLTLAAGAIFGVVAGTAYVFVAATVGATLAFLVSRYVARGAVESRLQGNESFGTIDRAVGEQGRKIVFLLRLSPVFPFNLLNYALGLTRVSLADYFVASIGMLPGTLLYVYSGKVAGDAAALASGMDTEKGPADYALIVVGLLATIVVTTIVTRIARRALAEATDE
jgi:uncharacterized membrane protein YdjX (TVP38/TMEM64 family)